MHVEDEIQAFCSASNDRMAPQKLRLRRTDSQSTV